MIPDRFARVKDLVLRTADLPEKERRAALDQACEGDADLRREVEEILAHDGTTEILKTSAVWMREFGETPFPARLTGRMIEHYSIAECRGEGGMGEVYKAEDTRLKRPVALKFVRRDLIGSERLKARFVEEARAAAALDHPNICTVHAIEEWEGQLFLVMAFLEGETLRDRVLRGPLEISEALAIAVQAAAGLEAAHSKGIVHRDIKSANIMLSENGRAQIVDFGLARSTIRPEAVDSGALMGTVAYMSPEQARGETLDHRTDIWSLGVVLYEMITGRLPFRGESEKAILRALYNDEPEPCRALRPDTPPELERIIVKAMAKDTAARYPSATELLADLERLRRRVDPALRPNPRRLRLALIGAAAIVVAVSGLLVREIVSRGEGGSMSSVKPLRVTSGDAGEGEPALSPDGTRIAYTSDESGTSNVYLIDVRGGNPRRLPLGPLPSRAPAWFPDGKSLAFVLDRPGSSEIWKIVLPDGPGQGEMVPAVLDGEAKVPGMSESLLLPHADDPAISPDGTRIAFVRPGSSRFMRICVASVAAPGDSLFLTHDDDGTWDHLEPSWSRDGQSICYRAERGLWIVPSTGGPSRQITKGESDVEPVWSPEGREIFFSSYREGTVALWRIDANGRHPLRLTPGSGPEGHPSISSDGAKLAYSTKDSGSRMFVLDRTTGRQGEIPGVRNSIMATLAPNGSEVVFVAARWAGSNELWKQSLREGHPSGDPQMLTDQPGVASQPVFSLDGRWVAYYQIQGDQRDIWVVSASGGEPIRFTDSPAKEMQPVWSPDDRSLAFISDSGGGSHIWVAPVDEGRSAGAPIQITRGDIDAFSPAWSLDGKSIAFMGGRKEEQDVWLVRSDGSKPPLRITSEGGMGRIRWDPMTGDLLVSGLWGGERVSIRSVSLSSGLTEPMQPVDFGSNSTGLFDISANGRWLVYSRSEDKGDVWVLDAKKGSY